MRRTRDDEITAAARFLGVPLGTTRERVRARSYLMQEILRDRPANVYAYYLPLW